MTTINRAVRQHLLELTDRERHRTARVLVRLRALVAVPFAGITAWLSWHEGLADWAATLPYFVTYAVLALALAAALERVPALVKLSGFSVPVLDMPTYALSSMASISSMETPEYLLSATVPALCAGVLLAGLSLDRRAIATAAVAAAGFTVALIVRLHAPLSELVVPLLSVVSIGVMCAYLVSRIEGLVAESRRKDFAGKYVLGERIGAGGMAEVFTALYSPEGGFERRVAVKRVLPAHAGDEHFVALFRREAEVGAQLAHPNLVQVLDFGRHDDSWFLAMEFVDGVSLSALLKALKARGERLPLQAALFVIAEVAEGLAYLHEKRSADGQQVGLVHRDLNPPNVLLSRGGDVKLSDFGVTRWSSGAGLTETGTTRGKLAYMAPEQVSGGTPQPAWDLFALGATAWEVLVGARAFAGDNESTVLRRVLEGEVPPPSSQRPDVPPEVDALVLGLLERDAAKRTKSAREVAAHLRSLTGAPAPYPGGREALSLAIASVGPQALAQAPASDSSRGASHEVTRTI